MKTIEELQAEIIKSEERVKWNRMSDDYYYSNGRYDREMALQHECRAQIKRIRKIEAMREVLGHDPHN
jgi:hypothetical protein